MEINNISIREYFLLEDTSEYDVFIDTLNAKNLLCGKVCNYKALTFDEVEVIKSILRDPNLEDIKELLQMLYNIRGSYEQSADEEFFNESIFKLFAAKKYLTDFIQDVAEKEQKHLQGVPDEKAEMVQASKRLAPVSHLLTKMRLAKDYATTPKEIGKWKYKEVFSILVAEKRQADVMKDYADIK